LVNKNLVGRCGLYCGACLIYRAGKDSETLRKAIVEREKCKPEDICCEGCLTVLIDGWNSERWGKNCDIVKCLNARKLGFCYECNKYPNCEKFLEIANSCLKHGENLIENQKRIKNGQIEAWLEEENRKWRCQKCSKPIAMHLSECHWCGAKLRKKWHLHLQHASYGDYKMTKDGIFSAIVIVLLLFTSLITWNIYSWLILLVMLLVLAAWFLKRGSKHYFIRVNCISYGNNLGGCNFEKS